MIKLKNLLFEGLFYSFTTDSNRDVNVFKNPSINEIKKCESDHMVGAFFNDKDCYTFNRMFTTHYRVKYEFNARNFLNDSVATLYYFNGNNVEIFVSDATRDTSWHHNPKIKQFLSHHPFLRNKKVSVSFYDGDIEGDWELIKEMKNSPRYCGIKLNDKSRTDLIKKFKSEIPDEWQFIAHHMTIDPFKTFSDEPSLGKQYILTITEVGKSDKSIAVKVNGYNGKTNNKFPHITLAVNKNGGGKPKDSNDITDWKVVNEPIQLSGTLENL